MKSRIRLSPGLLAGDTTFRLAGPNYTLMSCGGRIWAKIGKKLLAPGVIPLAKQFVDPADSVLGSLANGSGTPGSRGLAVSDADLIHQAFRPEWWSHPGPITLGNDTFTQMEANFSLFNPPLRSVPQCDSRANVDGSFKTPAFFVTKIPVRSLMQQMKHCSHKADNVWTTLDTSRAPSGYSSREPKRVAQQIDTMPAGASHKAASVLATASSTLKT